MEQPQYPHRACTASDTPPKDAAGLCKLQLIFAIHHKRPRGKACMLYAAPSLNAPNAIERNNLKEPDTAIAQDAEQGKLGGQTCAGEKCQAETFAFIEG